MAVVSSASLGSRDSSITITAKTIEAKPRGPNQPRNPIVTGRAPEPSIATATGSIRTSVRLSTAYSASSHVSSVSAGPSRIAPKSTNVIAVQEVPICSPRPLSSPGSRR